MGSVLLNKSDKPVISVAREAKVFDAVRTMVEHKIGAVVVLKAGRLEGIFTERDLMAKVVAAGLDPKATAVSSVMTSPVVPIGLDKGLDDAVQLMREKHIRHLPLVGGDGEVLGMLSIRNLFQDEIDQLKHEVGALENYAGYDGSTG